MVGVMLIAQGFRSMKSLVFLRLTGQLNTLHFSIRRDRFCMGTKTGKMLTCFEPKMEERDK